MRAKVTVPFTGLGENDREPKLYKKGQEITGNLAFQAVKADAAEWTEPPTTAERDTLSAQTPSRFPVQVKGRDEKADSGLGAGQQGGQQGASSLV